MTLDQGLTQRHFLRLNRDFEAFRLFIVIQRILQLGFNLVNQGSRFQDLNL